jgi:hypothetical protein
MERTINVQIPIYNPNLFKNTFAFKSDTLILSKKINDQEDVNEEQAVQITNNTYSSTNRLNALYIANATVSNTNFSHLSGLTRNIESTFISSIANIATNATNINSRKLISEYNTEKSDLETNINSRKLISEYDTEINALETNINTRKLISEYDTEQLALETNINTRKLISEYDTEINALETNINTRKLISEYDTEINALETNINTRKLISEYDTEINALETNINTRKLISEYNTEKSDLETNINSKAGLNTSNTFSAQNLFRKIGETNQTLTVASGFITLNSNTSHVAYINPQNANFQTRITNIVVANNTTFTFSIIIDTATNKYFCNTLQVNGTTRTMLFPNGIATVNIATANKVLQTISLIFTSTAVPLCLSYVCPFE